MKFFLLILLFFTTYEFLYAVDVIIDTDMGTDVDDTLAIVYSLVKSNDLNVIAISTCSPFPIISSNMAQKISKSLGKDIPIFVGSNVTLLGDPFFHHGYEGVGVIFPWESYKTHPVNAVDALNNLITHHNSPLELIVLGPTTNIAKLQKQYPTAFSKLQHIYFMGSSITPTEYSYLKQEDSLGYDYNFRIDPQSSYQLLTTSRVPITLVPGNVTLSCWLDPKDYYHLQSKARGSHTLEILLRELFIWTPLQQQILNTKQYKNIAFLHDPMTVMVTNSKLRHLFNITKEKLLYPSISKENVLFVSTSGSGKSFKFNLVESINCSGIQKEFMNSLLTTSYPQRSFPFLFYFPPFYVCLIVLICSFPVLFVMKSFTQCILNRS